MNAVVLMATPCTKEGNVDDYYIGERLKLEGETHRWDRENDGLGREKRWLSKITRGDTNGLGEDEVTVTSARQSPAEQIIREKATRVTSDDDCVYYYTVERLKLEGETENMGVCTKEWERHDIRGIHGHSRSIP